MSSHLLRQILASGFCGEYQKSGEVHLGSMHQTFDNIISGGDFEKFQHETNKVQACGQNKVPYSAQGHFLAVLEGIYNRRERFASIKSEIREAEFEGKKIAFTLFTEGDDFVNPLYDFYNPQHLVPMHSICAAYLLGIKKDEIKVRSVSVIGDFELTESQVILPGEIEGLLRGWFLKEKQAGGQCASCSVTTCKFQSPFEQLALEYFKAKQALSEIEGQVKQHLTWHGPTKAGTHLVYMKENLRRFFRPGDWQAFYHELTTAEPKGWIKYLSPDAKAVVKAVEHGVLPKVMLHFFKESRYHTIETSISM